MDVLVYLAGRAGEVVSKEELVERVWEGRYVSDDVLTVTIYALRKALGDEARRPRYIETVSRRGYRWIAPVETAEADSAPLAAAASPGEFPLPHRPQGGERRWRQQSCSRCSPPARPGCSGFHSASLTCRRRKRTKPM